ncbi:MAG: universal stress protein [Blastocatellia bacterium]|nr:universal stress protein [Blastocatellia bacterium]
MKDKMRMLIAYDGSQCADAALDDLTRAGLPREAEALVLSVADVWLWSTAGDEPVLPATARIYARSWNEEREEAIQAVEEARAMAERASERIKSMFPEWEVHAEASGDSPAWGVIKEADRWKADLVVVGSHGHSAIGRFFLGSVSQKVVTEAHRPVRIARGRPWQKDPIVRIVIGVDGSPDSEAALDAVAKRSWPEGSEARVVAALDNAILTALDWIEFEDEDESAGVHRMIDAAVEKLRAAGLIASPVVKRGDPRRVLVSEAEEWGADSLFVGARGLRRVERFLIGSVSAAVAARAHCSVEVARPSRKDEG